VPEPLAAFSDIENKNLLIEQPRKSLYRILPFVRYHRSKQHHKIWKQSRIGEAPRGPRTAGHPRIQAPEKFFEGECSHPVDLFTPGGEHDPRPRLIFQSAAPTVRSTRIDPNVRPAVPVETHCRRPLRADRCPQKAPGVEHARFNWYRLHVRIVPAAGNRRPHRRTARGQPVRARSLPALRACSCRRRAGFEPPSSKDRRVFGAQPLLSILLDLLLFFNFQPFWQEDKGKR